jgi:hypothetical protein
VFTKDEQTLSMLPEEVIKTACGVIALRCELINQAGVVVSEGRGSCSVAEKSGKINTAIKIAEKRALLGATLRAFSISDSFEQDLEEMGTGAHPTKPVKPEAPKAPPKGYLTELEAKSEPICKANKWNKAKFEEFAAGVLHGKAWKDAEEADRIKVHLSLHAWAVRRGVK